MIHERLSGLMLLEVLLMNQMSNAEESSSLSTATLQHTINNHLLTEKIETSVFLRSEAEQLVRHELIKNLGNFKQMVAAPLSP
jgi:hypothetical protein